MSDAIPLTDKRARLAWRLYFVRAESALAAAPSSTRQELLADLRFHIQELMVNDAEAKTERARLKSALRRVGDPKDFLSPLLATAVENSERSRIVAGLRTALYYTIRILGFCALALGVILVFASTVALAVSALGSLFYPERYGVFLIGESSVRIGVSADLTPGTYHQMLSPIIALPLIAAAGAALCWSVLVARALVLRLVAMIFSVGARVLL